MKTIINMHKFVSPFRRAASAATIALTASILACVTCSGGAMAAMVAGTVANDFPVNPEKHVVTITRDAKDAKQTAMITAAEAVQPDKEVLLKAAGEAGAPAGNKVWWYKEELGLRIPCAITTEAITYYSDLVGKYGKQAMKRHAEPSSKIDYHASVAFLPKIEHQEQKFENVYVVTLKLTFSQSYAATATESLQFKKERVVILDAAGKVLQVTGDGPTNTSIMAM